MSQESMEALLKYKANHGASRDCLRQHKNHGFGLFPWLPEGKIITKEALLIWQFLLTLATGQKPTKMYRNVEFFGHQKTTVVYFLQANTKTSAFPPPILQKTRKLLK